MARDPGDSALFATRVSLLNRLKDQEDQEGWREFFETYWRLIYSFARKSGLSESDAEDVVQDTMVTVAKQMPGFQYDPAKGSFKSWLLTLVKRRMIDRHRKDARWNDAVVAMPEPATGTTTVADHADPARPALDLLWASEWEAHVLDLALQRVRAKVSEKQYLMYEMHVLKEVPLKTVASNLQTSSMSVYMAKHRIGKLLRAELETVRNSVS
jgi:RNA polymerase sigma factor (sigma-70 family)